VVNEIICVAVYKVTIWDKPYCPTSTEIRRMVRGCRCGYHDFIGFIGVTVGLRVGVYIHLATLANVGTRKVATSRLGELS
jgi:hypothetical protein